jgi:hypothetical protein
MNQEMMNDNSSDITFPKFPPFKRVDDAESENEIPNFRRRGEVPQDFINQQQPPINQQHNHRYNHRWGLYDSDGIQRRKLMKRDGSQIISKFGHRHKKRRSLTSRYLRKISGLFRKIF